MNFCQNITADHVNGREVQPREYAGLRIYYNPSKGNTQMNVSLTYNQDVKCPQTGDKAQYLADRSSCERFLRDKIIDGCQTSYHAPYGKFGGVLTDACGIYAIQTKNVEPILCESWPGGTAAAISEPVAHDAIEWFCSQGYVVDPAQSYNPSAFYQNPPGYWQRGSTVVFMNATFETLPQNTGCQIERRKFAASGDECKRRLHSIVNKCKHDFC